MLMHTYYSQKLCRHNLPTPNDEDTLIIEFIMHTIVIIVAYTISQLGRSTQQRGPEVYIDYS